MIIVLFLGGLVLAEEGLGDDWSGFEDADDDLNDSDAAPDDLVNDSLGNDSVEDVQEDLLEDSFDDSSEDLDFIFEEDSVKKYKGGGRTSSSGYLAIGLGFLVLLMIGYLVYSFLKKPKSFS